MDKSLIEKLKEVIEQHHKETGERVSGFNVRWYLQTGTAQIANVDLNIEK